MSSYQDIFRQAAPAHDPRDIEELVRDQYDGVLDHLPYATLVAAAQIAAAVLEEAPDLVGCGHHLPLD